MNANFRLGDRVLVFVNGSWKSGTIVFLFSESAEVSLDGVEFGKYISASFGQMKRQK